MMVSRTPGFLNLENHNEQDQIILHLHEDHYEYEQDSEELIKRQYTS